jgi:hypothetical protein
VKHLKKAGHGPEKTLNGLGQEIELHFICQESKEAAHDFYILANIFFNPIFFLLIKKIRQFFITTNNIIIYLRIQFRTSSI